MNICLVGTLIIVPIVAIVFLIKWVQVYNRFNQWAESVRRKFADVKVLMQQRVTMMDSLSQIAQKYGTHEFGSFKEVTEARSKWSKDGQPSKEQTQDAINKEVQDIQNMENNMMKLQAVFEKYPELKANAIYQSFMGDDSISRIETRFRDAAKQYNAAVEQYNFNLKKFPTSIIANIHKFTKLDYITFKVDYESKNIFEGKENKE